MMDENVISIHPKKEKPAVLLGVAVVFFSPG
jgi:hypothetical protein